MSPSLHLCPGGRDTGGGTVFVHARTRAKARVVISGVAVLALMVIGAPLSGWAQDPAPSESAIASPGGDSVERDSNCGDERLG